MPAVAVPASDPAAFARRFSLEATRPSAGEIAALADILPRGTPLYLTAVPTQDASELIAAAAALRKAGIEPIVHIAARRLASAHALQELLAGLRAEADMRRLLVIGGDIDTPATFADALTVIQKGNLREAGIEEIGIGAYPEGHPRIPPGRLEAALDEKIATATAHGLRVFIVSQFSFSPERIVAWLRAIARLRHWNAGENRHGRTDQCPCAAPLRQALRRCGVYARTGIRPRQRLGRTCWSRPHSRNAFGGERFGRCRPALFFLWRGA